MSSTRNVPRMPAAAQGIPGVDERQRLRIAQRTVSQVAQLLVSRCGVGLLKRPLVDPGLHTTLGP
jgi:hypothetical protein